MWRRQYAAYGIISSPVTGRRVATQVSTWPPPYKYLGFVSMIYSLRRILLSTQWRCQVFFSHLCRHLLLFKLLPYRMDTDEMLAFVMWQYHLSFLFLVVDVNSTDRPVFSAVNKKRMIIKNCKPTSFHWNSFGNTRYNLPSYCFSF